MYASRTSSGMSMYRSMETSCRMSSFGNSRDRSSGPIGERVDGLSGGGRGTRRSGTKLYQRFGSSSGSRRIFSVFTTAAPGVEQAVRHFRQVSQMPILIYKSHITRQYVSNRTRNPRLPGSTSGDREMPPGGVDQSPGPRSVPYRERGGDSRGTR